MMIDVSAPWFKCVCMVDADTLLEEAVERQSSAKGIGLLRRINCW